MKRSLQLNPHNRPATWDQIKYWRDTHEQAPVTTTLGTFDADSISRIRLSGALSEFDTLPTLDSQQRLTWKLADNTLKPLTKGQLQQVWTEVQKNQTDRGARLFVKAQAFAGMATPPTYNQLSDINFWLQ